MLRLLVCLAVAIGSASAHAGEYTSLATMVVELHRHTAAKPKVPVKPVTPVTPGTRVCDNCNGVGKVGDGRTMLTCAVCDGTGKLSGDEPPPEEPAPPPKAPVKQAPPPPGTCRINADGTKTCSPSVSRGLFGRWRN